MKNPSQAGKNEHEENNIKENTVQINLEGKAKTETKNKRYTGKRGAGTRVKEVKNIYKNQGMVGNLRNYSNLKHEKRQGRQDAEKKKGGTASTANNGTINGVTTT